MAERMNDADIIGMAERLGLDVTVHRRHDGFYGRCMICTTSDGGRMIGVDTIEPATADVVGTALAALLKERMATGNG